MERLISAIAVESGWVWVGNGAPAGRSEGQRSLKGIGQRATISFSAGVTLLLPLPLALWPRIARYETGWRGRKGYNRSSGGGKTFIPLRAGPTFNFQRVARKPHVSRRASPASASDWCFRRSTLRDLGPVRQAQGLRLRRRSGSAREGRGSSPLAPRVFRLQIDQFGGQAVWFDRADLGSLRPGVDFWEAAGAAAAVGAGDAGGFLSVGCDLCDFGGGLGGVGGWKWAKENGASQGAALFRGREPGWLRKWRGDDRSARCGAGREGP